MLARPHLASANSLVRDYTKKRWMVIALLSTEIETLVTTQYPLENTREALVAILSNRDSGSTTGNSYNSNYEVPASRVHPRCANAHNCLGTTLGRC